MLKSQQVFEWISKKDSMYILKGENAEKNGHSGAHLHIIIKSDFVR